MINLRKGDSPVRLKKAGTVYVSVIWPAATDYDLGAEILYKDGTQESIATFGAGGVPWNVSSRNRTVIHGGDATRGAGWATETLAIHWDDEIEAVAPWAYSAQSNGTGSFHKYAVSMTIMVDDQVVRIDADSASKDNTVYTCVPGMIEFSENGVTVQHLEWYSMPGSERRPWWGSHQLRMEGPKNNFK